MAKVALRFGCAKQSKNLEKCLSFNHNFTKFDCTNKGISTMVNGTVLNFGKRYKST